MAMNWSSLPTGSEFNNLTSTAMYANTLTDNFFWPLMLLAIFMIAYITLSRYSNTKALLSSSFMTFILSIFLFFSGLISETIFFSAFGLFILAFILSFFFD